MLIRVKVKTGMKNESIRKTSGTVFEISVREKPEANQANARVVALIVRHFRLAAKKVRIMSGHHKTSKLLEIQD